MTDQDLIARLQNICGRRHVLTGARRTARFRKGFRSGEGEALAVVQPGTLLEQWKVLEACVAADKIVIMQAANTGLTEGSTPKGRYDRDVVLINTRRMDRLQLIKDGTQVISFPGSTLFALEKLLAPLKRQPHSVIGSSCIGASVVGGVCNNSGGSLVERGPSYTELSLFARITEEGRLELVNHLGIQLGKTPEEILTRLEQGDYSSADLESSNRKASDTDYARRVRNVEADTPARFNADKSRLYEAAGCAGKLAVFAVRLDTYPMNADERTFYVGTKDTAALTELRRRILADFDTLPVSAEYMHEEVFDLSDRYGKDTMVMIDKLGTDRLPMFFAMKGAVDARLAHVPGMANFTDKFMQMLARIWPDILPARMRDFRGQYPHHLILKMRDGGIEEAQALLAEMSGQGRLDYFECDPREAKMAGLHRFAAAGAAVRYMNVHRDEVEDILALDIALRRNDRDWFEELPAEISDQLVSKLYYGHFMCHVLHQDYIVKKGADPKALKAAMLKILDARGAEYPAEHNVGHLYPAKPDLAAFYKSVDPTNSMNPGIGKMSRRKNYG
ncbi:MULTISPECIES: D-lactate dehydrogenase [unclassified Aliiroseovarius]|uniref:D-lactate dehydrogenase n=1 Tax=unclassified Aliiroseovarius TaxID=2623558 RepID=UPI00156A3910|nr:MULTISPECIES: D-lactate dehydrogenase [unclassified Aliiroseovarius]NRP13617.1 D-lactate dehydrogenase [Aliiroseovarius sp. xm-d-517]NRP31468.1 D-lactate dehydrogenase [Aliiroseovarius sp. xm-m-314]NRP41243.1 D-lactate dehydrogenase [Aliiroseovarius sp. xm-m-339-2]NRP62264.1 D-lactate dehydrogenase [Aliiroseovarius sp. xm-a-151]NRP81110.1 D-lactate dehydrogenase [Aliiroseovarius sp. xm-v-209]